MKSVLALEVWPLGRLPNPEFAGSDTTMIS